MCTAQLLYALSLTLMKKSLALLTLSFSEHVMTTVDGLSIYHCGWDLPILSSFIVTSSLNEIRISVLLSTSHRVMHGMILSPDMKEFIALPISGIEHDESISAAKKRSFFIFLYTQLIPLLTKLL